MKTYRIICFPHEGGRSVFTRNYRSDQAALAWAKETFDTGNFKFIHLQRGRALIARLGYQTETA